MNACRPQFPSSDLNFQIPPNVLIEVQISRLRWPRENIDFKVVQILLSGSGCVLKVIIMLEDELAWRIAVMFQGISERSLQNINVDILAHRSFIDLASISKSSRS